MCALQQEEPVGGCPHRMPLHQSFGPCSFVEHVAQLLGNASRMDPAKSYLCVCPRKMLLHRLGSVCLSVWHCKEALV
jgi:hypothetical protein